MRAGWLVLLLCATPLASKQPALAQPHAGQQAKAFRTSGGGLHQDRRYDEAIRYYSEALTILERERGLNSLALVVPLNTLGNTFYALGRYAEAEPLLRRALAIREKVLGPDHPDVADSLNNLAVMYVKQGRYGEAEPVFMRTLGIREKALGPEHPDVALSLNNLAFVYASQGRYVEAEPLNQRALAIREKARDPNHPDVANSLDNLAEVYRSQGRYAEAEPLLRRALAIREKVLGPDHPDVADSLNNLAELYRSQGQYAEAEPLYKRALAIKEKALGPDHPDVASHLNNLALAYNSQTRYGEAELFFMRALAIREKALGPEHPDVALSLNNLAFAYNSQGRYAEAEPLHKRALAIWEKILGPEHPDVAVSLGNLAEVYRSQGRYAEAEPLNMRALAIREKALGPEHPDVTTNLSNLAHAYSSQARYGEAEPLFMRALAIREKALGPEHPAVARSLNNLATLYSKQGRWADALTLSRRAVAIHTKRIALSLGGRSGVDANERKTADSAFVRLIALLANQPVAPERPAAEEAFAVAQWAQHSAAAAALSQASARFAAETGPLATLVRTQQDSTREYQALDKNLIVELAKGPSQRSREREVGLRRRLTELEAHLQEIAIQLSTQFPRYAELAHPKPLPAADIQTLLGPSEVLLFFHVGQDDSFVWALTREKLEWRKILLSSADLSRTVQDLRTALDGTRQSRGALPLSDPSHAGRFNLGAAHTLYTHVLGPVREVIAGKPNLLVVASGALTSLPFHVLVTEPPSGSDGERPAYSSTAWLARTHAVTVLPAVTSLKALRGSGSRGHAPEAYLGFGDPLFSRAPQVASFNPSSGRAVEISYRDLFRGDLADADRLIRFLRRLPDTAEELREVAHSLNAPPENIRLGRDATERAIKQLSLDRYRILHFATHALVADETKYLKVRPEHVIALTHGASGAAPAASQEEASAEPALALSVPEQASDLDDGFLTASEVAKLRLNADWVILSACNTAAGEGMDAEALSGLARAFFYAGARTLLVSHWRVQSPAAVRLITQTIRVMQSGEGQLAPVEALRQAMVGLLEDKSDPSNADPSRWAPFAIVGTLSQAGQ